MADCHVPKKPRKESDDVVLDGGGGESFLCRGRHFLGDLKVRSKCPTTGSGADWFPTRAVWTQWCVFRLLVRPTHALPYPFAKSPSKECAREDMPRAPRLWPTFPQHTYLHKATTPLAAAAVPSTLWDISTSPFPFSASASSPQSPSTILTDSSYRVILVVWQVRWVD